MRVFHLLFLGINFLLLISCNSPSSNSYESEAVTPDTRIKSGLNRFVLTHCLGKKLDKEAHFYVDGERWRLDYNNGDIIYYKVISGNAATPMCGINTIDSFSEDCQICITKRGNGAIIQFEYARATISFEGYYDM